MYNDHTIHCAVLSLHWSMCEQRMYVMKSHIMCFTEAWRVSELPGSFGSYCFLYCFYYIKAKWQEFMWEVVRKSLSYIVVNGSVHYEHKNVFKTSLYFDTVMYKSTELAVSEFHHDRLFWRPDTRHVGSRPDLWTSMYSVHLYTPYLCLWKSLCVCIVAIREHHIHILSRNSHI